MRQTPSSRKRRSRDTQFTHYIALHHCLEREGMGVGGAVQSCIDIWIHTCVCGRWIGLSAHTYMPACLGVGSLY